MIEEKTIKEEGKKTREVSPDAKEIKTHNPENKILKITN